MFAGPNGSGKSTLFDGVSKKYNTGHFINTDLIENILDTKGFIDLEDYDIKSTQEEWDAFLQKENSRSLIEKSEKDGHKIDIQIKENMIIDPSKDTHSYEGALVSMFLREKILESKQSFSFETVMSHPSKLKEIQEAKELGYKVYFYFICIDDPKVNISRVNNRVNKGGHDVEKQKIVSRYPRTLENLYSAILLSDKTYLFDNSGEKLLMIAEIIEDDALKLNVDAKKFPNWFRKYVLNHYV